MDAQAAFVDSYVGPNSGDKVAFTNNLAGVLGKRDENVESAAADFPPPARRSARA